MPAADDRANPQPKKAKGIQSIEIGYKVLLAVQRGPSPVQLSEIARRAGLSSGAAHNYLVSLGRTGLVEQESRGAYRLGPSAFALSLASFQQLSSYDVMRDATRRLHTLADASVAASVWSQAGPVSVYKMHSESSGMFEFRTGLIPFLTSAAPRVFTAYLPIDLTLPLIEQELERRGRPKDEARQLIAAFIEEVTGNGYALTGYRGDLGDDVTALSAPVFGADGNIAFTLTLVGLTRNVHPDKSGRYLDALLQVARETTDLMALGGAA